ncbi:hypothetical protein RJ639_038730 [Escallonia herrerae]|uniref:KIB1-4 beta-propeller domain-containing protein n=1 Tax=Escallonia herrerae TaxID=1293975 RepID=A0AA88WL63_9ASTE|nr:hypothetical protein RJ639_038730 [Escallonia herrerae]
MHNKSVYYEIEGHHGGSTYVEAAKLSDYLVRKMCICPPPEESALHDFMEMIIYGESRDMALCRAGNESWTALKSANFRLNMASKLFEKTTWKHIKSLDNRVLFMGHNQCIRSSTIEYKGLKQNAIYFTADIFLGTAFFSNIFNLEDGSIKSCYSPSGFQKVPPPYLWTSLDGDLKEVFELLYGSIQCHTGFQFPHSTQAFFLSALVLMDLAEGALEENVAESKMEQVSFVTKSGN